ncbi:hypothetical protein AGMMS50293_26090 [Spirochaetia bacterium]|nr:hypothetical protein AGMMS50293_26090 [Spirochaetia bacterium]
MVGLVLSFMVLVLTLGGCNSDPGNEPGVSLAPPAVGNLPALPSTGGITAISTPSDADALLLALKNSGLYSEIQNKIYDALEAKAQKLSDGIWNWNFNDYIVEAGLSISATGGDTETRSSFTGSYNTTTAVTAQNYTWNGVTLYSGSKIQEIEKFSVYDASSPATGSEERAGTWGLTVSANGKAAKIIFSATSSGSGAIDEDEWDFSNRVASGFLRVYGAADALEKEVVISNKVDLATALGLLGASWLLEG